MGSKILIIDDEAIITKTLQKLLKKEGFEVIVTNSGIDALEKVKNNDFQLIICDIRMPDIDGIETIKGIRQYLKGEGKNIIPEILITGYADEDKYKNAVNLKVADYLYKPFDTNQFLEAVKRNLVN